MLSNIFHHPIYVVDRTCSQTWMLSNKMKQYNIMFIYEGEGMFERNGETVIAKKGDIVFYRPDDFRKAKTFPENLMKCYAVDFVYTCVLYENNVWSTKECDLPISYISHIEDPFLYSRLIDLFSSLSKMWLIRKQDDLTKIRITFTEIMTLLIQFKESGSYTYFDKRRADQIVNYITEHYTEKIALEKISEEMQLSYSYLGKIFKKVYGKPIIEYVILIRINKAKELLKDGYSVSECSMLTGFNDVFYFSKMFKKYESITPSEYRREHQIDKS